MSPDTNKNKDTPARNQNLWPFILGIAAICVVILIYIPGIYNRLGGYQVLAIYDGIVMSTAVAAAFLAARLWRTFERGETLSMIWGNIALGLILWAAGEIIWSSDQLWGGNSLPYPSMADALWIFGYAPVIQALILRLFTLRIVPNKPWQYALLAIYVIGFIMVLFFILIPIFTDTSTTRVFEKTINLIYPIGDLIIAGLAVYLVIGLIGGTLFGSWGLIALGFLCAAISDLLYAWTVWQGAFQVNPSGGIDILSFMINLLYVGFYLLVTLGLDRQTRSLGTIQ